MLPEMPRRLKCSLQTSRPSTAYQIVPDLVQPLQDAEGKRHQRVLQPDQQGLVSDRTRRDPNAFVVCQIGIVKDFQSRILNERNSLGVELQCHINLLHAVGHGQRDMTRGPKKENGRTLGAAEGPQETVFGQYGEWNAAPASRANQPRLEL